MKYNKVQITNKGLRVVDQVNVRERPETGVKILFLTDEELSTLTLGEKYVHA